MANWMRNESELDDFQHNVAATSLKSNLVVTGCAGSGKSIIALHRAKQIHSQKKTYKVIVYTKALRQFMEAGILELDLIPENIVYENDWRKNQGSPGADYIIIDEAQDFKKNTIESFINKASISISFFGDSKQQIYSGRLSMNDIIGLSNDFRNANLEYNYRLPKKVARVAMYVLPQDENYIERCKREGDQLPIILEKISVSDQLEYIVNSIRNKNLEDVAILCPTNRHVEEVKKYFDEKISYEFKCRGAGEDQMTLDFRSTNPKIMTFHSSKGLQFNDVFIPFCDNNSLTGKNNDDFYQKPLYVAITRTLNNVYCLYTGELTKYLKNIPASLFDDGDIDEDDFGF